jgi:hypothetical protein
LQSATGEPVIIDGGGYGSWTDTFNDTTGLESYDNLTINTNDVRLSADNSSQNITWDREYTADLEPDSVGWTLTENAVGDLASASGGILYLDTTPENAFWSYSYNWGVSNLIGATFEARVRIISGNDEPIIWLRDGSFYEGIQFFSDRIRMFHDTFNIYYMDTTDGFHIYRFTIKGNDYMVYVDGNLVINGTGQHDMASGSNVCHFGDFSDTSNYEGNSEWDFVRFNVSDAIPPKYFTNGNLTSTEISLLPGKVWDSLSVNKTEPGTDNFVNVTILDGLSFLPIPGFNDLTGTNINISSIDPVLYPSIRLYGDFVGNISTTPILHEWSVILIDNSTPQIPTGFTLNNPFTGYSLILSWDSNPEPDLECYVLY